MDNQPSPCHFSLPPTTATITYNSWQDNGKKRPFFHGILGMASAKPYFVHLGQKNHFCQRWFWLHSGYILASFWLHSDCILTTFCWCWLFCTNNKIFEDKLHKNTSFHFSLKKSSLSLGPTSSPSSQGVVPTAPTGPLSRSPPHPPSYSYNYMFSYSSISSFSLRLQAHKVFEGVSPCVKFCRCFFTCEVFEGVSPRLKARSRSGAAWNARELCMAFFSFWYRNTVNNLFFDEHNYLDILNAFIICFKMINYLCEEPSRYCCPNYKYGDQTVARLNWLGRWTWKRGFSCSCVKLKVRCHLFWKWFLSFGLN